MYFWKKLPNPIKIVSHKNKNNMNYFRNDYLKNNLRESFVELMNDIFNRFFSVYRYSINTE